MSGRSLLLTLITAMAVGLPAVGRERERGKWRLSVGPSVIGSVKSDLTACPQRMRELSGFGAAILRQAAADAVKSGRSKQDAFDLGNGTSAGASGKRYFDGGAWYDPTDSGSEDSGYSWNWKLHDPSGLDPSGYRGFVERTAYSSPSTINSDSTTYAGSSGSDSTLWYTGLRVEAAAELYCSEDERPWGVDAALAFAYYFKQKLWDVSGRAATMSASGTRENGYYEWWNDSHNEAQYILDYYRDAGFDGSMWGAGSFNGPGPELADDAWNYREVSTGSESWSYSHQLYYNGKGDYRAYSIELLARPWWEPWEWLRLFASVGIEVQRREFDWSMSVRGTDGTSFYESGHDRDWAVLGLLGGGLEVNWNDFFLYGEALWRFGGEGLSVSGRTVRGSIGYGDFGARFGLGYEF